MASTTILVVEDENIVAKDIVNRLKNLGYDVCGNVPTGEEALQATNQHRPDLVLMDIMLKGEMDGIEAAARILGRFNIPVIYLTAYADERTLQRAKITEAFGYLLKPFEERELHITIEMALYKHRMERRLRESEKRYKSLFDHAPDGILIIDPDVTPGGECVAVNQSAAAMHGYSAEEFERLPVRDILPARAIELIAQRRDQLENGEWITEEMSHRKRDGSPFTVENSTGIIDLEGKKYILSFSRDVTERKRAEAELRARDAKIYSLYVNTPVMLQSIDREYRLRSVSTYWLATMGYEEAEVLGRNSTDFMTDASRQYALEDMLPRFFVTGYLKDVPMQLVRKDGQTIDVLISSVAEFNEDGDIVAAMSALIDITERKKLEEQLRQAQKMESIGTLASGVAHDFNNVLNNVLGFAMQLKKYANDEAKVKRYSETIEKSATRGAELSSQLLSFARANRRVSSPTSLAGIIGEVVTACRETFPSAIVIDQHVAPGLLSVLGDHGELYQVLLNLCTNARDAIVAAGRANGGGTLTIEARNARIGQEVSAQLFAVPGNTCIILKVTDDGVGIAPSARDRIFDPFFTTKERGRGTGLGLSIVYNIIRSHKGTVLVDTEVGRGTSFTIYLPAVAEQPTVTAAPERVRRRAGNGRLVLLVDDEESMQELGKELLEDDGFKVIIARNGTEAVETYRTKYASIDLVILDLVMPGMDGGQAYAEMKKSRNDLKAFFCTGYVSDQLIAGLLAEEHLHAISKPFRPDDFLRLVYTVLEKE